MACGKCNFENLETGHKCGCLRYTQSGEDDLCKCKHYECFHEVVKLSPSLSPFPFLTPNSSMQQDFEYEGQNNPFNVDEMINHQTLLSNYGELNGGTTVLHNNTKNRNTKPFSLYCLPYGNPTPKIPRKVTELSNYGLVKSIYFDVDSNYGIRKEIETLFPWLRTREWRFFRCKSTSVLEIAPEPANGWCVNGIKRIGGVRKKLYIGTIDGPIQPFSSLS